MEELAPHRHRTGSDDLASIVLGAVGGGHGTRDRGARRRTPVGPERVPVGRRLQQEQGYDARSVAVLALVVAVLAALGGWLTSVRGEPAAAMRAGDTQQQAADRTASGPALQGPSAAEAPRAAEAASSAPVRGIDLAIGQVTARRGASGGGIVTVGVTNGGSQRFGDGAPATVLVLLDGDVVGTEPVQPLDPGSSTRVSLALGQCPAGSVAVTAVLDPAAAVAEGDERNNATTRSLDFGC